jgi:membrane fusion protein (multidrug efflux system)
MAVWEIGCFVPFPPTQETLILDFKAKLKVAIGIGLIGGALLLSYEVFYWFTHVYESNASVQTDFTNISAQVDGKIDAVLVQEGGTVKKGQRLITLVQDDIKLNIESLKTDLALEVANQSSLTTEKAAFEAELKSKLATQREKIRALQHEHQAIRERLALARKNLRRVTVLFNKKLTPETTLNAEQDKILVLRGAKSLFSGKIAVAKKERGQLTAARKRLDVLDAKITISGVKQDQIKDLIKKEELALSYRHITSPIDGVVGTIRKFKGEYLEDGVNILMLYDPKSYWIEANIDESQIRHVSVGQEVLVNLDAYPFRDFYGAVRHIGSITTAKMGGGGGGGAGSRKLGGSVERVPVRISLENPPPNLTPGMRADINVRIYKNIRLWSRGPKAD